MTKMRSNDVRRKLYTNLSVKGFIKQIVLLEEPIKMKIVCFFFALTANLAAMTWGLEFKAFETSTTKAAAIVSRYKRMF
jgi:hypothetical protein